MGNKFNKWELENELHALDYIGRNRTDEEDELYDELMMDLVSAGGYHTSSAQ